MKRVAPKHKHVKLNQKPDYQVLIEEPRNEGHNYADYLKLQKEREIQRNKAMDE